MTPQLMTLVLAALFMLSDLTTAQPNSTSTATTNVTDSVNSSVTTDSSSANNSSSINTSLANASNSNATNQTTASPTTVNSGTGAQTSSSTPASNKCNNLYTNCTETLASDLLKARSFCDAFNRSESCIGNSTNSDNSTVCTKDEVSRLEMFHCEPYRRFQVNDSCKAQIFECFSSHTQSRSVPKTDTYQKFFCGLVKVLKNCLINSTNGCTETEYDSTYKTAQCSSTALIFDASLVFLLLLAQIFLKE